MFNHSAVPIGKSTKLLRRDDCTLGVVRHLRSEASAAEFPIYASEQAKVANTVGALVRKSWVASQNRKSIWSRVPW